MLFYGITMMIVNIRGSDCITSDQYSYLKQNVRTYNDLNTLESLFPRLPIIKVLRKIKQSQSLEPIMQKFMSWNCLVNKMSTYCQYIQKNNCIKVYTRDCETFTVNLFISNYVNQICDDSFLSKISSGNAWSDLDDNKIMIDVCDVAMVLFNVAAIMAYVYFQLTQK